MPSKILEYADSVISNFDTTKSTFSQVESSGDLVVNGTSELKNTVVTTDSGSKLKVDTNADISGTSYSFPIESAPNDGKNYYLAVDTFATPSDQEFKWKSFETDSVEFKNLKGVDITGADLGGLCYVVGMDGTDPIIGMKRESAYNVIESQEKLIGSLVSNDDEMLITSEAFGSGKSLAKISVRDLIQSVQILATDIQVIGYANNKVVTQDQQVRIEVDRDGYGDTIVSTFNVDGFLTQGSISCQSLTIGRNTTEISLIGDEVSTLPTLGFNFIRGAKSLALEFSGNQAMNVTDDQVTIGSGDAFFELSSNSYFISDVEDSFINNKAQVTLGDPSAASINSINISNNFSVTVGSLINQDVSIGSDVEFEHTLSNTAQFYSETVFGSTTSGFPILTVSNEDDAGTKRMLLYTNGGQTRFDCSAGFIFDMTSGYQLTLTDTTGLVWNGQASLGSSSAIFDMTGHNFTTSLEMNGEDITGVGEIIVDDITCNQLVEAQYLRSTLDMTALGQIKGVGIFALDSGGNSQGGLTSDGKLELSAGASSPTIQLDGADGSAIYSGDVTVVQTLNCTTLNESSSILLKENIESYQNGLDMIMKMNPVSYNRINDSSRKTELGFIAEEIEKYLPEIVNGSNETKGISYTKIVPVLVSALQEQQKKIEELESKISK